MPVKIIFCILNISHIFTNCKITFSACTEFLLKNLSLVESAKKRKKKNKSD